MHGTGNDFIVVDCRAFELPDPAAFSIRYCHRRFGIGADQMLLLYPSKSADFTMKIFNADGSEVEMCGNGIRCFAKYIWDRNLSSKQVSMSKLAPASYGPSTQARMCASTWESPYWTRKRSR